MPQAQTASVGTASQASQEQVRNQSFSITQPLYFNSETICLWFFCCSHFQLIQSSEVHRVSGPKVPVPPWRLVNPWPVITNEHFNIFYNLLVCSILQLAHSEFWSSFVARLLYSVQPNSPFYPKTQQAKSTNAYLHNHKLNNRVLHACTVYRIVPRHHIPQSSFLIFTLFCVCVRTSYHNGWQGYGRCECLP